MSRSRRKHPIMGHTTAKSEKKDKVSANRNLRHISKVKIKLGEEPPLLKEVSNVYHFSKDGKQYLSKKTLEEQPKLMRK